MWERKKSAGEEEEDALIDYSLAHSIRQSH